MHPLDFIWLLHALGGCVFWYYIISSGLRADREYKESRRKEK